MYGDGKNIAEVGTIVNNKNLPREMLNRSAIQDKNAQKYLDRFR